MRHQPTLKTDATTAIIKVMFFLLFYLQFHHIYSLHYRCSFWRKSATWAELLSTSARSRPSRRQTAPWPFHQHVPVTQPRKLQVKTKRKRRPSTHSASSRENQRATDSQCHLNCMMLSTLYNRTTFFLFLKINTR